MKKVVNTFLGSAKDYGLTLIHLEDLKGDLKNEDLQVIPYLEFSAMKKINTGKLKGIIHKYLNK